MQDECSTCNYLVEEEQFVNFTCRFQLEAGDTLANVRITVDTDNVLFMNDDNSQTNTLQGIWMSPENSFDHVQLDTGNGGFVSARVRAVNVGLFHLCSSTFSNSGAGASALSTYDICGEYC